MVTEAFDIWSSEFDNWTLDIWSFVNFDIWTSEPMSFLQLNSWTLDKWTFWHLNFKISCLKYQLL